MPVQPTSIDLAAAPSSQTGAKTGFTLIEAVAALVLIAILGALFTPFLLGILQRTNEVAVPVKDANALLAVLERITNDYESDTSLRSNLALLRNRILTEPSRYGTDFEVIECEFIRFVNGQERNGGASDCLKVVLADKSGTLAGLFPYGGEDE